MTSSAPIFILSCARSGSTLLRFCLDTHPQLCAPPELHLLKLAKRLLWTNKVLLQDEHWSKAQAATRSTIEHMMQNYCGQQQKKRWCEKSISSVDHLDVLTGLYPEAVSICLYRHATDVVSSLLEATSDRLAGFELEAFVMTYPHRTEALLRYWLDKTEKMLAYEQQAKNTIHLTYEQLVTSAPTQLLRLTESLILTPYPQWVDKIFQTKHQQGPGDDKIYSTNQINTQSIGRGQQLSLNGVPRLLVKQINQTLRKLDYPEI